MSLVKQQKLKCGLHIITEAIENVRTVAMNWAVPAGVAYNECDGDSVLLSELVHRGIRGYSSKQHNDSLDMLGVNRDISCGIEFFRVSGVMLGSVLMDSLPLLGGYLLHPSLPENDVIACKNLCLQSIHSISDNPSLLSGISLNEHHLPSPFNRSSYGDASCIDSATIERLRNVHQDYFVPEGSILVLAGDVDHEAVVEQVQLLISDWDGTCLAAQETSVPNRGVHWIKQDSSQTHIGIAFDSPNASSENVLLESVAMAVFGGASSGRLFTHVRQRKSLCYSVSARYAASRDRSLTRIHAGTTPNRADETVRVCLKQLSKLRNGITKSEFDRTILRMKSRTVMGGESTTARANTLFGDQYSLGRVRTLAELLSEIDCVTLDAVNEWLDCRDFGQLTLVTLGPNEIVVDDSLLRVECG